MQGTVKLRIPQALHQLGWTQKRLAEESGISDKAISLMSNNPRAIRFDTLAKIIEATGISIDRLLVYEPNPDDQG